MHQIVNYHNVFQILVWYDSQILNKKAIVSLHTILSVHHSQNCLLLLIQVVNNRLSVILSSGSENINVVNFTHVFQKLQTVRSHIKLEFISLECELDVCLLVGKDWVNQCLIQIQNEEFLFRVWDKIKIYFEVLEVWLFSSSSILLKGLSSYWLSNTILCKEGW